jgi:hypothetical protein
MPPSVKPKTTGTRSLTRLYASSIKEKVRAAMSTPAPKAMIEPITLFLRLTKDARAAPAISGKLAIKPQSRESNKVPVDEVNYFFTAG